MQKELQTDNPKRVLYAVRQVTLRDMGGALPALRSLLSHPDKAVLLATFGALQHFRDRESVPLLIAIFERDDDDLCPSIIFTLAEIGGEKAEEYLERIMLGHPDPTYRRLALQALRDLREREESQN